jgi:hypothetical protein
MTKQTILAAISAVFFTASVAAAAHVHHGKTYSPVPGTVVGYVTAGAHQPVIGARVTFLPARHGHMHHHKLRRVVSSEAGHFKISVPAGRYVVRVYKHGVGQTTTHAVVKERATEEMHVALHSHQPHHKHHV